MIFVPLKKVMKMQPVNIVIAPSNVLRSEFKLLEL